MKLFRLITVAAFGIAFLIAAIATLNVVLFGMFLMCLLLVFLDERFG